MIGNLDTRCASAVLRACAADRQSGGNAGWPPGCAYTAVARDTWLFLPVRTVERKSRSVGERPVQLIIVKFLAAAVHRVFFDSPAAPSSPATRASISSISIAFAA